MGDGICLKRNLIAGNHSPLSANVMVPAEPLALPGLLDLLKAAAGLVILVQSKAYDEIESWQISGSLWSE